MLHHPPEHWRHLRDELSHLLDEVPLYRRAGPIADDLPAFLAQLPIVHKRDLRRGFPKSLVRSTCDLKAAMAAGLVEILATSGTTDDRLQVLWEWAWWDPQERQAMRLNARVRAAMEKDFREAVLTTPICGGSLCHIGNLSAAERTVDGMLFLNQTADPTHWTDAELDRMAAEWNDFAPDGVEADPAYLAALCRHVERRSGRLRSPRFVTLTYEQTLRAHRRAIARVLDAPLYSLYGATEAGVLFMECTHGRLHHNSAHSHIELIDGRVVVTTLGRTWNPLLRYHLGDFVSVAEWPCECGLPEDGYLLHRIEGRDAVAGVTTAGIDDALDDADPAIVDWQLDGNRLRVVGSDGVRAARALSDLLGRTVVAQRESAIAPEGSGKYRRVKA
jgi:phenylacetate-coenzyme A ligase PaaK-like adenylate-forming protein